MEAGSIQIIVDAALELVIDRPQPQIVLKVLEGRLDFDELNVEPPQIGGIAARHVGAQQVAAFAPARLA